MQRSLYLNTPPVQSDPFKCRGPVCYVQKRAWGCISSPRTPVKPRKRPTFSAVRNSDQQSTQGRCSPTAQNEQCNSHFASGITERRSKMVSKTMPVAVALLSTAALACWSMPAYADASVQAVEQVAQQLTSDSSGSLSECVLAIRPGQC